MTRLTMPEYTATGVQCVSHMASWIPLLLAGQVPAAIGRKLSSAMDKASQQHRRLHALKTAIAILQSHDASLWTACGQLEISLVRYETAYRRIHAGHRVAHGELEAAMVTLLEIPGPRCQKKVFELLTELSP